MAYPHKWSPISCKSSAGQRKDTGQRPMLYRWTTQPINAMRPKTVGPCSSAEQSEHCHKTGPENIARMNEQNDTVDHSYRLSADSSSIDSFIDSFPLYMNTVDGSHRRKHNAYRRRRRRSDGRLSHSFRSLDKLRVKSQRILLHHTILYCATLCAVCYGSVRPSVCPFVTTVFYQNS